MANKKTLVVVFQRGAMDGLNVVVPHADGHYHDLRPNIGLPEPGASGGVLDLDGFFGLNPALSQLKALYDAGELALVHAAGSPLVDRSHFSAQARMEIAAASTASGGGWLGRYLQASARATNDHLRAVSIGNALDQSLIGSTEAAAIADSANFRIRSREPALWRSALPPLHDGIAVAYERQSHRIFSILDEFATEQPYALAPANGASYPGTSFGQQMKQAAQYIRAGLGLEVITTNIGSWDHHANENPSLTTRLTDFGDSLAAFRTDLGTQFEDVIVVSMSEFGRRAAENAAAGTDHGKGSAMFVLGGAVNGGQVIADWPGLSPTALDDGDLRITTDYRAVLNEVLSAGLANASADAVFPGFAGGGRLGLI
jgi:uncharacterized protein (DUF1501 family)